MFDSISKLLFDNFVINNMALGIQQKDGKYKTTYLNFNSSIIEKVLEKGESILVYQQQLSSDLLKWVCLDFDYKEGGSLQELVNRYVNEITNYLDEMDIAYLLEYSGRRGIHVWIFFDRVITKFLAYNLINGIYSVCKENIEKSDYYAVDLYPKTATSSGNKVGLGVKLPLSKHKKSGTYSYLIKDLSELTDSEVKPFSLNIQDLAIQLDLLRGIKKNNVDKIIDKFKLDVSSSEVLFSYKKQSVYTDIDLEGKKIIAGLRKCQAYNDLFDRVFNSYMLTEEDRYILLGTFGHIKPNGLKILNELLKYFPNYNAEITKDRIKELLNYYNPPTMNYVHMKLGFHNCECCYGENSVLEFLRDKCDLEIVIDEKIYKVNLLKNSKDLIKSVIEKEKNYLRYNDEVANLLIHSDMKNMTNFHVYKMGNIIDRICNGEKIEINIDPVVYKRFDSEGKYRKLVSLQAMNRVITTAIATKLNLILNTKYDSYSYNPSPYYGKDVFYSWATSWKKWNLKVKTYLDLDLFEDYKLLKIDIKSFYDSIYISHVIDDMKRFFKMNNKLTAEAENMLNFLVDFNGRVIAKIGNGTRGVPQGPAYARIIAEYYLFMTFLELKSEYNECEWLRYVDDIYIFSPPNENLDELKRKIEKTLNYKSLEINISKTKLYLDLKSIPYNERNEMYNFYDLRNDLQSANTLNTNLDVCDLEVLENKVIEFLGRKGDLDINDFNFLMSERIENELRKAMLRKYSSQIFSSINGRGSIYSKIYGFILSSNELTSWFNRNEYYCILPKTSINLKTYLIELFYEIKTSINSEIYFLAEASYNFQMKEVGHDDETLTYLEAINRLIERRKFAYE